MRRGMPEVWRLVKPLVIYYAGYYVIRMVVGTLLVGGGMAFLIEEGSAVMNGIAMLGGCAALFPMIGEEREAQRKERKRREEKKAQREENGERKEEEQNEKKGRNSIWQYLLLAVFAVSSVVFFNVLVGFLGLAEQSGAFQEAAKRQYAVSLGMGLLLYAGVSAVTEEVVFRFLLYNRLRRAGGRAAFGVVASAFLFGVYHGNVVQGIYAFTIGVLLALCYIYFDDFFAPVLFHGLGNAVIFASNMVPEMYEVVFSPVVFWICGAAAAAGSVFLIWNVRTTLRQ